MAHFQGSNGALNVLSDDDITSENNCKLACELVMLLKTLNITNRPFQTDIHAHFLTRKVRVNSRLYYYLLPRVQK